MLRSEHFGIFFSSFRQSEWWSPNTKWRMFSAGAPLRIAIMGHGQLAYDVESLIQVRNVKDVDEILSSFSPTKIEEVTAGSGEKNTPQPCRESNLGLPIDNQAL